VKVVNFLKTINRVLLVTLPYLLLGPMAFAQPAGAAGGKSAAAEMPVELQKGEGKFKANCARCHGERAAGTQHGPPLVHKIYEPSHHGDAAFQRAAASGVRAHHWSFGDMPRIEAVTPEDVAQIIQYVRWLQRQAGIQ
jgi:mono/diheme cytochrome c family protein